MKLPATAPALTAPIAIAALLLAGCGTAGTTAATSAAPTVTMVGSGTPPVTGSTGTSAAKRATRVATGKHDRAGGFCSGRDQARYAAEGLLCVTGRLKPAK